MEEAGVRRQINRGDGREGELARQLAHTCHADRVPIAVFLAPRLIGSEHGSYGHVAFLKAASVKRPPELFSRGRRRERTVFHVRILAIEAARQRCLDEENAANEQNKERRLARVSNYNRSPVPCDDIAAIVTCRCSEFTIGYVSSLNICLSFLYSLPVLHICFFVLRIILMADFMILNTTLARERFNETL